MKIRTKPLDVVCMLECPGCKRQAVGVTEASVRAYVEAHRKAYSLFPAVIADKLMEQAPALFDFMACRHCRTACYLLVPTAATGPVPEDAQYVIAPPLPFALQPRTLAN